MSFHSTCTRLRNWVPDHAMFVFKHDYSITCQTVSELVLKKLVFCVSCLSGSSEVVAHFPKELPKDRPTRELVVTAMQTHIVRSQQR